MAVDDCCKLNIPKSPWNSLSPQTSTISVLTPLTLSRSRSGPELKIKHRPPPMCDVSEEPWFTPELAKLGTSLVRIRNDTLLSKCALQVLSHCHNRPIVDLVFNQNFRCLRVLVLTLSNYTCFTGKETEGIQRIH